MTFRLRHRACFDPLSIIHSLKLRAPRLKAPDQWNWAWPLQCPTDSGVSVPTSPVRHVWVSAIRVVAVSDDATALAFVSHTGTVALATHNSTDTNSATIEITAKPFVDQGVAELCADASSVTFFDLASEPSVPPRKLLAVGYHSGAIAIFDVTTATLMTVTRPHREPVRRLRFYPSFHLLTKADPYPVATGNSGLLAVFGWCGTVARISSARLLTLLTKAPTTDLDGARWLVWNLSAQDAVLDAVACSSDPSSICEMDAPAPAAPLRITAVGVNPPIAAYSATSDQAFSARAAAKRAATTVLSAARGFLLSKIGNAESEPVGSKVESSSPVIGVVRHSASWADDPSSVHGVINFGDVRDTARKSVNAVLQRGRRLSESDSGGNVTGRRSRRSGNGTGFNFRKALRNDAEVLRSHSLSDGTSGVELPEQHVLKQQRYLVDGEAAKHIDRLPRNARIIERLAAAPLPCNLIATCDTLGRIFVQDARDLCVLRVLKGYRDAHVAWLEGGPLLAVYAPRLNVLEVHDALQQKRKEAFRLVPGSMISQSASHRVFSVSPEGHLYELMRARKDPSDVNADSIRVQISVEKSFSYSEMQADDKGPKVKEPPLRDTEIDPNKANDNMAPDSELVSAFTEAVKTSHMSDAIDCLQRVEHDAYKLAHLMATLVTCTAYTSSEMHVALSSKAAQIAVMLKNPNLLSRFEAHRKIAEAFELLASDTLSIDLREKDTDYAKNGKKLFDDEVGSGLAVFALLEQDSKGKEAVESRKRVRMSQADAELITCERFILSHAIAPTVDFHSDADFELQPRSDLSKEEQIWLSKAYFLKLLDTDSMNTCTPGREHPTTVEVFLALTDFIGLHETEIARQFVQFFLYAPLPLLLRTHASMHASPLRCAVARLRSQFPKDVVDPIVIDGCETSSCVPNAVLLTRLCAVHEASSNSEQDTNPFLESLTRLGEVLLYRKMIMGSTVPPEVYEKFTARRCTGVRGDAERHAVTCLIAANDFEQATKVLTGLEVSTDLENLDRHESASVSESALHACRKKAITLLKEDSSKVIPKGVLVWILAAREDKSGELRSLTGSERQASLQGIRIVLLHAQQHIPDSSVDAVRCLQLAEAMLALLAQENRELSPVAPFASQDLTAMDIQSIEDQPSEVINYPETAEESGSGEGQKHTRRSTSAGDKEVATIVSPLCLSKEDQAGTSVIDLDEENSEMSNG